jgi:plastocyanin
VVIATLGVLALAGACSSDDASSSAPPTCDTPEQVTSVTMGDFFYEPTCIEAKDGSTIEVVNEGEIVHTFTVEGTDLDANLKGGDTGELTFEGLTAGTVYEVICRYHNNMTAAVKAV